MLQHALLAPNFEYPITSPGRASVVRTCEQNVSLNDITYFSDFLHPAIFKLRMTFRKPVVFSSSSKESTWSDGPFKRYSQSPSTINQ